MPEGTSVLRAAALADINIPKLCASDNLEAFGSCRMCAVQVEGKRGYPAACTTPVEAGMQVTTQNTKLARLRRNIMELYISDHPLDCLTCPANGDCELQDVAGAVGLREVRYGFEGENHLSAEKDNTNPYFSFDPSKCIVCSRCVRACEEVQGTFALTIDGRGFDSKVSPGQMEDFMDSECVSCGACVQACPTATLMEKSVIDQGVPEHSVITTCAYCGVGCSFKAEMKGDQLVRMVPYKGGDANHGHSCVKGRFAFGYATHGDRLTTPMIRDSIDQPWREVGWEEAINFAAERLKATQAKYGRESIGGITSSRCTNEETYLVQKLIRAAFGNNNTDTCARVCHSPTGYGLKTTLGESAGTQTFDSVMKSDAIIVIGANPTDAHPVFASQMRRRMREGASLIVADPRHIDLLDTPHRGDAQHLPLRPGTNVALVNALAHVVVSEGLEDHDFIAKRCDTEAYQAWRDFISEERHAPEAVESITGVSAEAVRRAARTYAKAPTAPSTMAWASPSTARARPWSWASPTWPWPPATSGAKASGSTRCAARTMSRAPATWAPSPMSCPAISTSPMPRPAAVSRNSGACPSTMSRACAFPTCSMRPSRAASRHSTSRARTSPSRTPTPSTSRRR
ncbi:putative formate dehydrogenase [Halomonas elongata]|uniref:Putative formate dehydrogenase n=1 Tax=Halomonas elongata TaxID=2746 RepID=A0A1B8P4Y8_HALEL|nr:putative formate dehydrogenase [Halomonas elongata]